MYLGASVNASLNVPRALNFHCALLASPVVRTAPPPSPSNMFSAPPYASTLTRSLTKYPATSTGNTSQPSYSCGGFLI